jgi:hypothetical protein
VLPCHQAFLLDQTVQVVLVVLLLRLLLEFLQSQLVQAVLVVLAVPVVLGVLAVLEFLQFLEYLVDRQDLWVPFVLVYQLALEVQVHLVFLKVPFVLAVLGSQWILVPQAVLDFRQFPFHQLVQSAQQDLMVLPVQVDHAHPVILSHLLAQVVLKVQWVLFVPAHLVALRFLQALLLQWCLLFLAVP